MNAPTVPVVSRDDESSTVVTTGSEALQNGVGSIGGIDGA